MSYAANLKAMSRTPVTVVRLTMDWCANTFGVLPCTGTGEPCYNTYHTCRARAAYVKSSKVYEFCSTEAPIPWPGPRPYVKEITYLPTEITNTVTISGRIKVQFLDEPDGDIGIDPYVLERASVQGTFWKKFIARNPNYKGRMMDIYEGFLGDPFSEFQQRASQPLQLVTLNQSVTTLQTVDLLKTLGDIEVPPQMDVKILGDLTIDAAELILDDTADVALLPDAGYIKVGAEYIQYAAIDRTERQLSGCTRGVMGSTAAVHSDKETVQLCRYYPPANPFDVMQEILVVDGGCDSALVDAAAFDYWRDWPQRDVDVTAFLDTPTKISDLLLGMNQQSTALGASSADLPPDSFGLVDLLDCQMWVGEDLKITVARKIPNAPGRVYLPISDAANIITRSASVDMNEKIRVTRTTLYWDKSASGAVDASASYGRRDIGVNIDAETEYAETITETLYCRWLKSGIMMEEVLDTFISDLLARRLFNRRDAAPIISLSVELKDSEVLTGSFVTLFTDELLNPDGTPILTRYQVIRRDPQGASLDLKVQRMTVRRGAFYAPEDSPLYQDATEAQQEYGGFYSDDQGMMPNGDFGSYYF